MSLVFEIKCVETCPCVLQEEFVVAKSPWTENKTEDNHCFAVREFENAVISSFGSPSPPSRTFHINILSR